MEEVLFRHKFQKLVQKLRNNIKWHKGYIVYSAWFFSQMFSKSTSGRVVGICVWRRFKGFIKVPIVASDCQLERCLFTKYK